MTTKNIVNIQNNKLDFYINGTNRFDVNLKGTNFLSVNELGKIIAPETSSGINKRANDYDFEGYISNIDNQDLGNLGNVSITSLADTNLLQYDGTNWVNVAVTSVGATDLRYAGDFGSGSVSLNNGTLTIAGTTDQITTVGFNPSTDGRIQISLAEDVIIPNTLTVGTNTWAAKIEQVAMSGFVLGSASANISTEYVIRHVSGATFLNSTSGNRLNFAIAGSTKAYVNADDFHVVGDLYIGGTSGLIVAQSSGLMNLIDTVNSNYVHYSYNPTNGVNITTPTDFLVQHKTVGGSVTTKFQVGNIDTTVKNNLVVDGNLTVSGNSTILNTEVKLIEDPLIELNYIDGSYSGSSDIGFFGRYGANSYTGFVYDTSEGNFKAFDSMSSNAYAQEMTTIDTTNVSYVPILAKTFEVEGGYVGKDVYTLSVVSSTAIINIYTAFLSGYYGGAQGMYSGRLIAYSHSDTYRSYAITTINYNMIEDGDTTSSFIATVDAEVKGGTHNYLSYNEDNKTIFYDPPSDVGSFTPVVKFRILPIVTL